MTLKTNSQKHEMYSTVLAVPFKHKIKLYKFQVKLIDPTDIVRIVHHRFHEFCWAPAMNWFSDILLGADDDCKDNEDDGGV